MHGAVRRQAALVSSARRAVLLLGSPRPSSLRAASGSHHNGNGTAGGADVVHVRFHIPYITELGEDLAVVGAGDYLGNWQVERRLALQWQEGHEWVGGVDVPSGTTLEYKYIVTRGDGTVVWSPGNNFMLEVMHSAGPGCTMDVFEQWVGDGPRHVSISEPEPGRAPHSNSPQGGGGAAARGGGQLGSATTLVSNLAGKLQDATARLGRVEWEAAVVGLLSQQPLLTVERIHAGLQALRPSTKRELELSQLDALLEQMVQDERVVELDGRYRLHASSKFASGKAPPLPASLARGGKGREGVAPPPSEAQLVPAVMRLLEAYSSMSLDRILRALVTAGPAEVQGVTGGQLQEVLSHLKSQGRVLADASGLYRKGLATPSASRRAATPSASRRPAAAGSPPPSARRIPSASPSPTRASPASAGASQPQMSPNQLAAYETRVLSLLANYSSSTAERIHAQLKATTEFPGSQQDTLRLLRNLAAENRVRDSNGNFSYLSTRQSTPTGARGHSASPSLARRLPSGPPIPRAGSPPPMRSNAGAGLSNGIGALRSASASSPGSNGSSSSSSATFATAGAASSGRSPSPGPARGPSRMVSARSMSSGAAAAAAADAAAASLRGARAAATAPAAGRSALPTSGRRGAEREDRESGAARRSLSAYSLFCAERKEAVRAALPRAGTAEIRRVLASEWLNAPGDVRTQYETAADADRRRFEEDVQRLGGGQDGAAATTPAARSSQDGGWSPFW